MRPTPGRWQGYGRPQADAPTPYRVPYLIRALVVLAINGQRMSLAATLKLTTALRGLLMRDYPIQPPPE